MFNLLAKSGITEPELVQGLAELGLDGTQHVIVHASLRSFGRLDGGVTTLLNAVLGRTATLVAPAFTYGTMLYSETSPVHARYSVQRRVSREIGQLPQAMVDHPRSVRSQHPVLSFVGIGAQAAAVVGAQTLASPYQPVGALYDLDGYSLMIGTGWDSNTSVHYGEYLAGVPYLTRYAEIDGEVRGFAFPNCSADFGNLAPEVEHLGRRSDVGRSTLQLYRVRDIVDRAAGLLAADPEALFCRSRSCRCQEVRGWVRRDGLTPRVHPVTVAR